MDGLFDALRASVGADALPKTISRETLDAVVADLRCAKADFTRRPATPGRPEWLW